MTQVPLFGTPSGRSDRLNFQEGADTQNNDFRERSLSEINQKSIGSDSFTSGHSSRVSRRSEIKSLKGERFIAKLTRSASNSPRIEYNSNSFLEYVKTKMPLLGNIPSYTQDEREHELQFKPPSQGIEDLESEWKSFKQQHNFESRAATSPHKPHLGLESPSVPKASPLQAMRKNRHEENMPTRKTNYEKNTPMPNLLSKVIPQAKINLVQPSSTKTHNRYGVVHSKSLEPKKDFARENHGGDRQKKNDPLRAIYDKYSNINKKKESFGNINTNEYFGNNKLESRGQTSMQDKTISQNSVQSFESLTHERISHQDNDTTRYDGRTASPIFTASETKLIRPGGSLSTSSDARLAIKDLQIANYLDSSLKESERSSGRVYDKNSFVNANDESLKGTVWEKQGKSTDRFSLFSVQTNFLENPSIEESDKKRDSYHQTNKTENKSKLLYFEHNYKEEQESLFNVPATTEKCLRTQKSVSPKKANLNLIRSIKVNANSKQDAYPDSGSFFGTSNEKENIKVKESLRNHLDVFMDKVKLRDDPRRNLEDRDPLTDVEESESQTVKRLPNDLSIQKPLHFVTRESNFSPSKKRTPDNNTNLKFRKENPFKQDQKSSPGNSKQSNSVSLKQMPREKPVDNYLREKGVNTNSLQNMNSLKPKVESISLKTEFVTLESARLQKHKLMTLNSATKSSILSDSRSREGNPFYFLATQEDNIKEPNIENIKTRHKKIQNQDSAKYAVTKKSDENILRFKNSIENEAHTNIKPSEKVQKNKPKILKVRK